tara:strand:+ start:239 stop:436 length:198 start_codon:yes stop_codon:yes gene_type:complete
MATLDINIPDAQIANLATFLHRDIEFEDEAERLAAVKVWLQGTMNNILWEMAHSNAIAAVEDPTV